MAPGAPSHRDRTTAYDGLGSGERARPVGAIFAPRGVVPATVLVIADHRDIATLIANYLASAGLRPLLANDVRHAGLLLQREPADAVVLDLATPGHAESVVQWLRREPSRAGMAIVRVNPKLRHADAARAAAGNEVQLPKPFTPKQVVDGVRSALARRAARLRVFAPAVQRLSV
jgi:DNA-binding response OmpR family regulator